MPIDRAFIAESWDIIAGSYFNWCVWHVGPRKSFAFPALLVPAPRAVSAVPRKHFMLDRFNLPSDGFNLARGRSLPAVYQVRSDIHFCSKKCPLNSTARNTTQL
jgi:hypothetical protein